MIQHQYYTFKQTLGQGGMATVYLADHDTLHHPVAVKVLNKEFVHNENMRKRFLAEARNMFKMSHPNIIRVTDLIDQDDMVAFVMEYIEGQTVKEYLDKKGKLSDEETGKIFIQMLDAVGYVHEQGLIHRDIKPSNFMISNKGVIKLMDFGISKNTNRNSSEYTITHTTQQMGTPMYMSPEQIKSTKDVTLQSDIYSLGVVLWQLVTGSRPYDSNTLSTFEIQTKIVKEPLINTNTKWDKLIKNATQKELNMRYNTILDLKEDFLSYCSQNRTIVFSEPEKTIIETVDNQKKDFKGYGEQNHGTKNSEGEKTKVDSFNHDGEYNNDKRIPQNDKLSKPAIENTSDNKESSKGFGWRLGNIALIIIGIWALSNGSTVVGIFFIGIVVINLFL